jgi:hypothetical protein
MKANAYVETTVISYLTAQASRDIVVAAHQQITRDWWKNCRNNLNSRQNYNKDRAKTL